MLRREQVVPELFRREEQAPVFVPKSFFDIDGTLTEGFTIVSFAEFLSGHGQFNLSLWGEMQADFRTYGSSSKGRTDYELFARRLVNHYAQGLAGRSVLNTQEEGQRFFDKVEQGEIRGYRLCLFTEELASVMRRAGLTIAISGSPLESLLPLKQRLSFDELRATTLEVDGGVYTGRVVLNLAIDTAKSEVVNEYLTDIDRTRSFAFGDSVHDLPILEAVANPFVLGNNSALQAIGRERGWTVADNEKEVLGQVQRRLKLVFGGNL